MAVREVPRNEYTKDGKKWIYEFRYKGKRYKSKKYMTKKEALAAERAKYDELDNTVDITKMTIGDLFEAHYEYQKDKVKATTLNNYGKKLKHFNSLINIKLDKLTIQDIEKWKQEVNSQNLATRTKNDYMKYFKSALNFAMKWYDFNLHHIYNKMTNFTNPDELPKEMQFYTYEEFNKFISVEEDLKYRTMFETLYYCGLRRGELRALPWRNIDFERKILLITQNIVNVRGDSGFWQLTTPKTRTSNRQVPVPDVLLDDLILLKEECKKYYDFNDNWFVFGDITPIHPHTIRMRNVDNAKKAGLKQIRIHDFRHSCASLLINNGADPVMVARYLGHSKIDETLNTYSHVFKSRLDSIVDTINQINKSRDD